ncbi:MAG: cytochrome c [Burkholderiaceae bacterium]|nr:cytochrome c [Burkholderiaceae bacterium]
MKSKLLLSGLLVCLSLHDLSHAAGDPQTGRAKAQSCVVCHGPMGISVNPGAPHLAGQPAVYLIEQMQDFRSGKRQNPVMSVIAKPLSDRDIQDLAAWYASIEIQIKQ